MYYAAYGSNLEKKRMINLCESSKPLDGVDYLEGYRLAFKGPKEGSSYLTIEKCEDRNVPIGIYEIKDEEDIKTLDRYESYPTLYSKNTIKNNINGKDTLIYEMNDGYDYNIPSADYYYACLLGYRDFGISTRYLEDAFEYTKSMTENKRKVL